MALTSSWDALILAGGTSSRMAHDKASLVIAGETMLARSVNAASQAKTIVVSGLEQALPHPVVWSLEDPPFSGPVAAIVEALPLISSEWVVIIPCDLAHPEEVVAELTAHNTGADALIARDPEGHIQWLTARVKTEALSRAVTALESSDIPVRNLFAEMNIEFVDAPSTFPAIWEDMDTPEELLKVSEEKS